VQEINRSRHSAYLLHVHIVFVTKYRRKVFGELHLEKVNQYAGEVCGDFGAVLKECDGEADHVHMLVEYPPTVQLSKLVNSLPLSEEGRGLPLQRNLPKPH